MEEEANRERERKQDGGDRETEEKQQEGGEEEGTGLHEVGAVWSPVRPILGPQL